MTADEVDAFFAYGRRALPTPPEWRDGNRVGERRATLPVSIDGTVSAITIEVTTRLIETDYLMALMLCPTGVICRLCMTTGHFDRSTRAFISQAHFHSWAANRAGRATIPKELKKCELVPAEVENRDEGFAWFLHQNGIDLPDWLPMPWAVGQGLL